MLASPTQRRPARVCFVIDRLRRAGTESQLLALIAGLDRSKVVPHLCTVQPEDAESLELAPADCPTLRLGLPKLLGPAGLRGAGRLWKFLRQHRIDVVQTYFLDSTYLAAPVARCAGIRHVLRVRNNLGYWLTPKHRHLGKLAGKICSLTLTNAESGRAALVESEGLKPHRVKVLENGVDLERFAGLRPPDLGRPDAVIGVAANLRPVKNIDGLIRAVKLLEPRYPRLRLDVAGEGEQRPELERLVAELGLGGRVRLLGSVADVPAFLGSLDAAALPSHSEAMSNALLEYLAAGRPAIATDVGSSAKILGGGAFGEVVPPGDDSALAEGLARLLGDPSGGVTRAELGREFVAAEYSRMAMRRRFEALYQGLCGRGAV